MRVRRRWVERHPERRRRLARPVISVGNLSMGGTGKSPVVAEITRWLVARGERPAILSRGYGRADAVDGVVVVSDGLRTLASIDRAGDEPLMLARQVPGAIVCVSPDRHLAGTLAERQLGCTVHVLDDGFQHIDLDRQLDVLVTTVGEIPQGRVIPAGRLREPADAAARAHVLVVSGATAGAAAAEAWALGISLSCGAVRTLDAPIPLGREDASRIEPPSGSVMAVAGIANPERFSASLKDAGWAIGASMAFPDHHRYSRADVEHMASRFRESGATSVLTTDKDAVRLEAVGPFPFPLFRVPLRLQFEPANVLFDSIRIAIAGDDRRPTAGALT